MAGKSRYEEPEKRMKELEKKPPQGDQPEKALLESGHYFQAIIDALPEPLMVINRDYSIAFANKAAWKMAGAKATVSGLACHQILHHRSTPCDGKEYPCPLHKVITTKKTVTVEHTHLDARDNEIVVELVAAPVFDHTGEVSRIIESCHNITQRKRAEEILRRSHEELQAMVEERTVEFRTLNERLNKEMDERRRANEALQNSMKELHERVKELNCMYAISHLVDKFDFSLAEMLRRTVELIPPACQFPDIASARLLLQGQEFKTKNFQETAWKQLSEITLQGRREGTLEVCYLEERPEQFEGPFLEEERELLDTIAERLGKIVTRKRAEKDLQKSEKNFRDLIRNTLAGILIIQHGQVVYTNPELDRLFGPLPAAFALTEYEGLYPEDVEKVKHNYQKIISGESRTLDMDFRFYPVGGRGETQAVNWVYCRASVIEYQGEKALLFNMMDITRAKELERLITIQDKMSSLGRVAAGIAHEIRNPLSTINVYLSTLKGFLDREIFDSSQLNTCKEIIADMENSSHKIETVIKRVMDFSRPGLQRLELSGINQCIREALDLSAVTIRKSGITLETHLAENLPECYLDRQSVGQLMLNLITNAIEALRESQGEKRIEVVSSEKNENGKRFLSTIVIDSGLGVPLELRDRIFDPFFTTKQYGSGIGLSICQRIVNDHRGSLRVATGKAGGATFIVEFPFEKREKNR